MLQIYGQATPHSDVFVIGTRESLVRLRQTVDRALAQQQHGRSEEIPSDGEHYHIYVFNTSEAVMRTLPSQYIDNDFSSIPGRKDLTSVFYQELRSYIPVTESRR